MDGVIAPAAFDAADALAEATEANLGRVSKYLARYREVQAKRAAMEVRVETLCEDAVPSMISDPHGGQEGCGSLQGMHAAVIMSGMRLQECGCFTIAYRMRRCLAVVKVPLRSEWQRQSAMADLIEGLRTQSCRQPFSCSQAALDQGGADGAAARGRGGDGSGSDAGSTAVSDLSAYASGGATCREQHESAV